MALRMGVIGLGAMGMNHLRVLEQEGAQVVATHDARPAAAAQLPGHLRPTFRTQLDALLRDPSVEAVTIATPTATHHQVALAAIEAGKHFLVEKPVAASKREGDQIVQRSRRAGVVAAVGHIERFNPVVQWARAFISEGGAGALMSLSTRRISPMPSRIADCGVVLDIGIHDIDVCNFLIGAPPRRVFAVASGPRTAAGYETGANILAEYEQGAIAAIEVSWNAPMRVRKLSASCRSGYVDVDYMYQTVEVSRQGAPDGDPTDSYHLTREYEISRIVAARKEPLALELRDFVAAVRGGGRPGCPVEAGVEALAVAEGALRSIQTGMAQPRDLE